MKSNNNPEKFSQFNGPNLEKICNGQCKHQRQRKQSYRALSIHRNNRRLTETLFIQIDSVSKAYLTLTHSSANVVCTCISYDESKST